MENNRREKRQYTEEFKQQVVNLYNRVVRKLVKLYQNYKNHIIILQI